MLKNLACSMFKKIKIIIVLSLVLLALVLYLIFTSASVKKPSGSVAPVKNKNVVLSDESYEAKAKEIFAAYEKLVSDNNFTVEKIAELKKLQDSFKKEKITVEKKGISVSINGNFEVEEIKLNSELGVDEQQKVLKDCLNEARESIQKKLA